ncbi:MAG: PQQ-like beta-propeller repeat protein [bacterium]|nr:PQQ-like beta-propeller repeat protein [bacterium]
MLPSVRSMLVRALALLPLAIAIAPAPAQGYQSPASLENRWYVAGGGASRSGAVATRPLLERPESAWQVDLEGDLVGEPLVWDDRVILECELPTRKRRLVVLDLVDGREVARRDFARAVARSALAPTLWHRDLIARIGNKYRRYRLGVTSLTEQRASEKLVDPGPPLRVGGELFVIANGHVECRAAQTFRVLWRSKATGFRGQVARTESALFAVRVKKDHGELVELDVATGERRRRVTIATTALGRSPMLAVSEHSVVLHGLANIPLVDGSSIDSLRYDLPLVGGRAPAVMARMRGKPALTAERWLAACGTSRQPMLGLGERGAEQFHVLATESSHPELLPAPVTIAGQIAYLSGVAIDLQTFDVRWRLAVPEGARAIPARDHLLFAKGRTLQAYRRAGVTAGGAADEKVRAWVTAFDAAQQRELQALVAEALAGYELVVADELLSRCRAVGVEEAWVQDRERERRAKARARRRSEPARAAALRRRAGELREVAVSTIWRALAVASKPPADRLLALRFVHGLAPDHPPLATAVRALVPEPLRPRGLDEFDVDEWLAFLESTRAIAIEFVDPPTLDDARRPTAEQRELLGLMQDWRADLVGVRSDRLLVYTPVDAPGGLARCLALGEQVCDTLDAMFEDRRRVRKQRRRMRILLYPSAESYRRHSSGGGHLAWTAGHYSASERLSRMYLPDDEHAFARVMPVFVHELTHQWLQERCPAISSLRAARRDPRLPGYWLVEGFASFVEQFVFDVQGGTHRTDDPRNSNLDILAHAEPAMLVDWSRVLRGSAIDFQRLDVTPRLQVGLGHRLGVRRALSSRNLFYAQAGALCHWLWHANDGEHRAVLLDLLVAHYQNDRKGVDLSKAIGRPAGDIGTAAVRWAKDRAR